MISVYNRFVERVGSVLQSVKIGPSLDRTTEMGPLASKTQLNTVLNYLERGKQGGAVTLLERAQRSTDGGYYVYAYSADRKRRQSLLLQGNLWAGRLPAEIQAGRGSKGDCQQPPLWPGEQCVER